MAKSAGKEDPELFKLNGVNSGSKMGDLVCNPLVQESRVLRNARKQR